MAIHSKLAVVKIQESDTSAGDLTDISTHCDRFEIPREMDEVEVTTFGATDRQYISGFGSGTVSVGGPWTRTLDGIFSSLYAAFKAGTMTTVAFEYGPEGDDPLDVKYTGLLVLLNYSGPMADVGDAQQWEAEFRITGNVTVGAYS